MEWSTVIFQCPFHRPLLNNARVCGGYGPPLHYILQALGTTPIPLPPHDFKVQGIALYGLLNTYQKKQLFHLTKHLGYVIL